MDWVSNSHQPRSLRPDIVEMLRTRNSWHHRGQNCNRRTTDSLAPQRVFQSRRQPREPQASIVKSSWRSPSRAVLKTPGPHRLFPAPPVKTRGKRCRPRAAILTKHSPPMLLAHFVGDKRCDLGQIVEIEDPIKSGPVLPWRARPRSPPSPEPPEVGVVIIPPRNVCASGQQ
jgi:hypothetical protein